MTTTDTRPVYVTLPVTSRAEAEIGVFAAGAWHYEREVRVEADGDVLAWDEIGELWTRHHDLTEAQATQARRLADAQRERRAAKRTV